MSADPSGTAGGEERASTSSLRDRQVVIALTYFAALLDVAEAAEWACDLIDQYDEFLIALGEDRDRVYSATHLAGKAKARAALAQLNRSALPQKEDGS